MNDNIPTLYLKSVLSAEDIKTLSDWTEAVFTAANNDRKLLEVWKDEGERIFAKGGSGVLFWLGMWWADRPWRTK